MTAKTTSQKQNDNLLKIVALVCAVLLWFYADAQENPLKERQLTIPVRYVNLVSGYVVENAGQSVQITVKGNETDIMSLRSDDFTAVVDLSGAVIGSATYPVQVNSVAVTEKYTYTPDRMTVVIDQIEQKEVPIHVQLDGTVAPYYELTQIDAQLEKVVIQGKSSVIADIQSVETVSIDITGFDTDKELLTMLQLPEGVTAQTTGTGFYADAEISVYLHIDPLKDEKDIEAFIEVYNVSAGLTASLDSPKASLVLHGDKALMEAQPILDQVLLYVDCTGLDVGEYILPIQMTISNDTMSEMIQSVSPQEVTVILEAEAMSMLPNAGELITTEMQNE